MAEPAKKAEPKGTPWQTALLDLLGAPATAKNYSFLNAWAYREQPHKGNLAAIQGNNPFFTTAGAGGSAGQFKSGTYSSFPNTPGVARYPNIDTGVYATAATLTSYPTLVSALRSGDPSGFATNSSFQSELSKWSGSGYSSLSSIPSSSAPSTPYGPELSGTGPLIPFWKGYTGAKIGGLAIGDPVISWPSAGIAAGAAGIGADGAPGGATTGKGLSTLAKLLGGAGAGAGLAALLEGHWLQRLGEIILGFALILVGLVMFGRASGATGAATAPISDARTVIK